MPAGFAAATPGDPLAVFDDMVDRQGATGDEPRRP
jgi:hypothetical protein